jgi:hypothetical protein
MRLSISSFLAYIFLFSTQDVLRVLKIKGLPAKRETGQVKAVLSVLRKELREYHHRYYAKVCLSCSCTEPS